jgi:hypothetical protein
MKGRIVELAKWREGMQGQDGYYDLLLKCGHTMKCEMKELCCFMYCPECKSESE